MLDLVAAWQGSSLLRRRWRFTDPWSVSRSWELDRYSTAAYSLPESTELDRSSFYRDSIRNAAARFQVPDSFTRSISSSCSYSGASYSSNYSGCSMSGADAGFRALRDEDLKMIARRMVSDGYMEGLVREVESGGPDHALERWFNALDVDWILQIRGHNGLLELLGDESLQDLVERWTRALAVMLTTIKELALAKASSLALRRFADASIGKMQVFVEGICSNIQDPVEKLQAMLNMYYICVCNTFVMKETYVIQENQISRVIHKRLSVEKRRLMEGISSTMDKLRTLVEEDSSWTIGTQLRGSEVHRNTRLMLDCITLIRNAERELDPVQTDFAFYPIDHDLSSIMDDTIDWLKNLLREKSELCYDPGLRYLFLLNNFYFLSQKLEPEKLHLDPLSLAADCEGYIESYFDASWAHVLSCLSYPGPLYGRNKTSSLAKFESAFRKTYQAHRFFTIRDPKVRDKVRNVIAQRVISGCREYLEEHPELQKHLRRGISTPDALEKMLRELFEG